MKMLELNRLKQEGLSTGFTVDTTYYSNISPDYALDSEPRYTSYPEGVKLDTRATIDAYISKVSQWHRDRNLIEGSTDKDQVLKLTQELGELSDSVCKGEDIRDDIGDMLVVMINIIERNNLTITDCLEKAWNDIKDRKGKMVDGIFVKEENLENH
jgi:NTP pyrophosphatase (non-canonical NTP hydrolase)